MPFEGRLWRARARLARASCGACGELLPLIRGMVTVITFTRSRGERCVVGRQ